MIKALLKKQLLELLSHYIPKDKKGKPRRGISLVLYALLLAYVIFILSFSGYFTANILCVPLSASGLDWLYFAVVGIIAAIFGIMGTVFASQSQIFDAKDNDTLLAMPIPPKKLLFVRALSLYIQAFFFEAVIMIPGIVVYVLNVKLEVTSIITSSMTVFLLPVFTLALSLILGWLVTLVGGKVRNKSAVVTVLSLMFFAVTFYLYSKINVILMTVANNGERIAGKIKKVLYPLYQMGKGASGDIKSFFIFALIIAIFFGAVYFILSRSFILLATSSRGVKKKKYTAGKMKARGASSALINREIKRFLSSPTCILNFGISSIMLIVAAVFMFVKAPSFERLIELSPEIANIAPAVIAAAACLIGSSCVYSAASVSLEGKTMWIIESLPVSMKSVIISKLKLQIALSLPAALVFTTAANVVMKTSLLYTTLTIVTITSYFVFFGACGLVLNILAPNLNWSSEAAVVKRGMSVTVSIFGGWGIVVLLGVGYYFLSRRAPVWICLSACSIVLALAASAAIIWLMRRGVKRIAFI